MEKLRCSNCKGKTVKNGFQKGKQRYKCTACGKRFQVRYNYQAYNPETNNFIKNLLREGCGIRSISRILNISSKTVLSRMLKMSDQIKAPCFNRLGGQFEVDELWSYVGNKKNAIWVTYAMERETKQILDFFVGRKTTAHIKPLIDKILARSPKKIFTDGLNIYPNLIPKEIHKRFQYCTNRIERMNLNLRTHIKRLSRKTICFSKEKKYLKAHLTIYFWGQS